MALPLPLPAWQQRELVRERETFRYDPSLIAKSILNAPDDLISSRNLTTSSDATLTSFCQLAALRLNASRSLVSLFDRSSQYVVAEATQSGRLLPNSLSASPDQGLWLCGTHFTRSFGVCERVIQDSAKSLNSKPQITVINDLAEDETLRLRPYCHGWPNNRFYAGIPLMSPRGIVIGVLCVFDSQPRSGLDSASKTILQDLSQCIMSHLEHRRVSERYRQADRVTRGIRRFFHGSNTKTELQRDRLLAVEPRLRTPGADFSPQFNHSTDTRHGDDRLSSTCASAAHIMRDALEVDGLLLLDASHSHRSPGAELKEPIGALKDAHLAADDLCPVLGSSVTVEFKQEANSYFGHSSLHTSILRRLLHYCPRGTIWTFDSSDSDASDDPGDEISSEVSDNDDIAEESDEATPVDPETTIKHHTKRQQLRKAIKELLPGAKSVAFFPIWNAQKRRWFAGGFAYTSKTSRVFSPKRELSYLRALGTVLMAEVSFIKEREVEHSKLDVLDSISHELRSPLHGIFFGTGVLRSGNLNASQNDALLSVEACSQTLLDTIDQILDWSKINHFTTSLEKGPGYTYTDVDSRVLRSSRTNSMEAGMMSIASDVDLPQLIEDVIESVHVGHEFQKHTLGTSGDSVRLVVHFEPSPNWSFHVQPGAIRRIVMNILGNSLRFTSSGAIHVRVGQSETEDVSMRLVTLTISDTGCGMSSEFLANDLFSPFTQQNMMDAGTGLGLSIVRRITQNLGGDVEVQSVVSVGTTVRVTLPMQLSDKMAKGTHTTLQQDMNKGLEGLRVTMVGLQDSKAENATDLGWDSLTSEKDCISTICQDWLGSHIVEIPDVQHQNPHVVLCDERYMDRAKLLMDQNESTSLVAICDDPIVARKLEMENTCDDSGRVVLFTHRPVGPRKLQRLLSRINQGDKAPRPKLSDSIAPNIINFHASEALKVRLDPPTPPGADCEKRDGPGLDLPTPLEWAPSKSPRSPLTTPLEKPNPISNSASTGETFLLVDDNPINLKMLIMFMKKLKLQYSTASNGQEAVIKYKENPSSYKCVFMDISMPVMNGFEATRHIRTFEAECSIPKCSIFALTGLASRDAQQEAVLSGIDLFLTKPIALAEMRHLLESKKLI
ncbi:hypothetical protein EDB82DRAFT_502231 [Fusarium venenatum]|uniref:uncharacterized protein n=1 Tax=Fusarium venenatum TaxID=56646 RepID=UPI001DC1E22A|nr:hypothetical protein EDB82DRAFT_502231 [Fusarium venenatum]